MVVVSTASVRRALAPVRQTETLNGIPARADTQPLHLSYEISTRHAMRKQVRMGHSLSPVAPRCVCTCCLPPLALRLRLRLLNRLTHSPFKLRFRPPHSRINLLRRGRTACSTAIRASPLEPRVSAMNTNTVSSRQSCTIPSRFSRMICGGISDVEVTDAGCKERPRQQDSSPATTAPAAQIQVVSFASAIPVLSFDIPAPGPCSTHPSLASSFT